MGFRGRATVMANRYLVSSGHYLATKAGIRVLETGGNAVDAGVAAGLVINVCQPDMTSLGGVAPIMIRQAGTGEVSTVSGVGWWPKAATLDAVKALGGGGPNPGVSRAVVPAAVDAWLTALARYGTRRLVDVATDAIELADQGFPVYREMRDQLSGFDQVWFDGMPTNRTHFLPDGVLPEVGTRFRQPALGATLLRMVEAEASVRHHGREAGIAAARDRFYKGDIADDLVDFYAAGGGLLTREDLAEFSVEIERPIKVSYRGFEVYSCGPWSQGPVVPMALNILEGFNLKEHGWGSADTLHLITESLKLAFSDRHSYIGDPRFVRVPVEGLVSKRYADERRRLIDMSRAWSEMPPCGDPWQMRGMPDGEAWQGFATPGEVAVFDEPDTSYVCVVDEEGNAFSATPSDAPSTPIVPSLGLIASSRGYQSWADPGHAASIVPGKRPRLTPSPGIVLKDDAVVMPYGTPGNDRQPQAMVQFLVNVIDFGMSLQDAVDAPRLASYSFPATGHPHKYEPGVLQIEATVPEAVRDALAARGHGVVASENFENFGGVCAVRADRVNGVLTGAADPRRTACAVGW